MAHDRRDVVHVVLRGDDAQDAYRELRRWLADEPEFRGRVRLVSAPPGPGEMGGSIETLDVELGRRDDFDLLTRSIGTWHGASGRRATAVLTVGGFPRITLDTSPATVPITIYLSDAAGHDAVQAAVEELVRVTGGRVTDRDDPVLGSWFRRMTAWFSSPAAREARAVALHAVEARTVLKQDAEITSTMLQNLGAVLEALNPTPDAVLRVGALLIVKNDGVVVVHQLTAAQQLQLDHSPHLALAPREILSALRLGPATSEVTHSE